MRKYKQVKRKEVVFDLTEWAEVERRAAAANLNIGTYIKKIAVNGELTYYDMQNAVPLVNAMRTINNNVNQIARKANETHSIYAEDIRDLQTRLDEIWEGAKEIMARLAAIL